MGSEESSKRLPPAADRNSCIGASRYVERESKLVVSIGFLLSETREPQGKEEGKIVGVRGFGGHWVNVVH